MSAADWTRVSAAEPCPICKHDSWCSVSADRAVASCMRQAEGAYLSKPTDAGTMYFHRLGAEPAKVTIRSAPPRREPDRADPDTLDAIYRDMLRRLKLSPAHHEDLRRRGLTEEAIDRGGYKSLSVRGRAAVAQALQETYGDVVFKVPGLGMKAGADSAHLTIHGSAGMLIPVRDPQGRVLALKVRGDKPDADSKYSYVSSKKSGGPGPGAPVHVPAHAAGADFSTCRLTEGELKADVSASLGGVMTISAPGIGQWRPAVDVIIGLGAQRVLLAFDADAWTNPSITSHLGACFKALREKQLDVAIERWPIESGKGIDDVLVAGGVLQVLEGDAAEVAIDALLAEMAVLAVPPEGERSEEEMIFSVVREGGAAALLRDSAAMAMLADLEVTDLARSAALRVDLRAHGVTSSALKKPLRPLVSERRRQLPPPPAHRTAGYEVIDGAISRIKSTEDGPVPHPLCNFDARIIEEVKTDDGVESETALVLEGKVANGRTLPRVEIPGANYAAMHWVVQHWGAEAIICAGLSTRDQLREGIQRLSHDIDRRTVYTHTGWTQVDGEWFYLTSGGAIGADGLRDDVEVRLQGAVDRYSIPAPIAGDERIAAVRGSLGLLDGLAPDPIAFAIYGATYRAPLGPSDLSIHITGKTGVFKTELVVLHQRHFGATFDRKNLPATWQSTGNALEMAAFAAKDALIVIDEFVPTGGVHDRQKLQATADRVFRAQGNGSGRQRCRTDGSLRPAKPPRGFILSCGEEAPQGQSLRARVLQLELKVNDIAVSRLTECQRESASGTYATAMSCYLQWLAPKMAAISKGLERRIEEVREAWNGQGGHRRTATNLATIYVGLLAFFEFAVEIGAITPDEKEALLARANHAFATLAESQAEEIKDAEPARQYLRLLGAAFAAGRAHLVPAQDFPRRDDLLAWGWRRLPTSNLELVPQGTPIGWIDGHDVFLEPDAAYAEAQRLARDQGEQLAVAQRTLHSRLRDAKLLLTIDEPRGRLVVRRVILGVERKVLHLAPSTLVKTNGQNGQLGSDDDDTAIASHQVEPETASRQDETAIWPDDADGTASQKPHPDNSLQSNGRSGRSDSQVEPRQDQELSADEDDAGWER